MVLNFFFSISDSGKEKIYRVEFRAHPESSIEKLTNHYATVDWLITPEFTYLDHSTVTAPCKYTVYIASKAIVV